MEADGTFDLLPKKEVILLKEAAKLEKNFRWYQRNEKITKCFIRSRS